MAAVIGPSLDVVLGQQLCGTDLLLAHILELLLQADERKEDEDRTRSETNE